MIILLPTSIHLPLSKYLPNTYYAPIMENATSLCVQFFLAIIITSWLMPMKSRSSQRAIFLFLFSLLWQNRCPRRAGSTRKGPSCAQLEGSFLGKGWGLWLWQKRVKWLVTSICSLEAEEHQHLYSLSSTPPPFLLFSPEPQSMAGAATLRLGLSTTVRPLWKPPLGYIQTLLSNCQWRLTSLLRNFLKNSQL